MTQQTLDKYEERAEQEREMHRAITAFSWVAAWTLFITPALVLGAAWIIR